jgi:beta-aspartyl-peptidase (threonine type)
MQSILFRPFFKVGLFLFTILAMEVNIHAQDITVNKKAIMVIHGGAGTILKENMTDEKEDAIKEVMAKALLKGYKTIKKGKSSDEAVVEAIKILEDAPYFNAGQGAVLNEMGKVEMDASIMNGKDLAAGAVAGVKSIKNPIEAALAVKNESEHVFLYGDGAETFAKTQRIKTEDPSYFIIPDRKNDWERAVKMKNEQGNIDFQKSPNFKYGTVGAVALDEAGNISAGTSTGGMMMKKFGRIGDSPIIGAGTYANNETCGISCTGHGEYFIRYAVAYDISALMAYSDMSINDASEFVIQNKLKEAGGAGGLIGLDKKGNYVFSFNTPGMYRGVVFEDGTMMVEFYK